MAARPRQGDKRRDLPIPTEVADALLAWQKLRARHELDTDVLFPRLGHRRRDGAFPDAGPRYADGHRLDDGELSGRVSYFARLDCPVEATSARR